jgi:sporulation protein YlmC with PRC-barrel domain
MRSVQKLLGMPIVTVGEGSRIGRLSGLDLDMRSGTVRFLRFHGEGRVHGYIPWEALHSIGHDAITIDSVSSVLDNLSGAAKDLVAEHVGDRPVVTESGTRLGTVTDYELDEHSGEITRYCVSPPGLLSRFLGHDLTFDQSDIRAFGPDAILVADSVNLAPRERKAA